jgi:hypothetical protein
MDPKFAITFSQELATVSDPKPNYSGLHYLTLSHTISHYLTLSHIISHHLTLSHIISHHLTLSQTISHHLTLSHTISHISHYLTLSHTISHHLTLSHTTSTSTFQSLAVSLCTVPTGLTFKNSTWCSLCVECFVRISEQTATFALYNINWLVFKAVVESVYSAVRTDFLYKEDYS